MKPIKRSARKPPKPDPEQESRTPAPRPFRSDRPEGPLPVRRGQQGEAPPPARRWPTPRPQAGKPWQRGQGPGLKPQRPSGPRERDWPRRGSGNPQRAPKTPHPRNPHPRGNARPFVKEHPQYGNRIPPEEMEFLKQSQERHPHPRGGRPQAPIQRRPRHERGPERRHERPHERPPGGERRDRPRRPNRVGVQRAGEGPPRPVPVQEESPVARLVRTLYAYQESAALFAAHALGIFPAIHQTPQVAEDVARRCNADPRGIERLLNALVSLGVLHKHGATYVVPRELAPYVVPGFDGDATGLLDFSSELFRVWNDLPRAVKEGKPLHRLTSDALLGSDSNRVRRYIRGVHTNSRQAARRVVEMAPLLPGTTLLDVAGGSGIFAAEYTRATPGLKAILFDLAPTIEAANEILAAEGLDDQVTYRTGDYRSDPLPGPVDAVLLSNVLQTESEETCQMILAKSREALRPGGTLLIHGVMTDPDGTKPPAAAMFSLHLYTLFDQGRAYPAETISSWLNQEGFGIRFIRPLAHPFRSKLILATRLE
jgi:cyclopropane fatty-acyl-phospholipid synthase-like methyltransferase